MTKVYVFIAGAIFLCLLIGTFLGDFVPYPTNMIVSLVCGGAIGITLSYLIIKDQDL